MKLKLTTICLLFIGLILNAQFAVTPKGLMTDNKENFIVLEFKDKTKESLFTDTLVYLNTLYISPKDVISKVENEVITINANASNSVRRVNSDVYDLRYNIIIKFKDDKLRFEVAAIEMINYDKHKTRTLHFAHNYDFLGYNFGIYNKKGKLKSEKAKEDLESHFNNYVEGLKAALSKAGTEEW